jgi:Antibiotic biosynthesis monooxygenase
VAEPLTLINAFEVPGDQAEQFIAAWEKTRDYLETQPGYVDTALHQAVMPGAATACAPPQGSRSSWPGCSAAPVWSTTIRCGCGKNRMLLG